VGPVWEDEIWRLELAVRLLWHYSLLAAMLLSAKVTLAFVRLTLASRRVASCVEVLLVLHHLTAGAVAGIEKN